MCDSQRQKIDSDYYNKNIYSTKNKILTDLQSPFQRYRIAKVLEIYSPNLSEKVLDLGCGWGTFCFVVASLCSTVTGIDFSEKSIELCNKLLAEKQRDNIRFICAKAQATGMEDESYDVIICADLFEHLYPQTSKQVIDECCRLLKKGGKLVIWSPYRWHIFEILKNNNVFLKKDLTHVDYKPMEWFIEELEFRHFSMIKNYYTESHIPFFRNVEKLLLKPLPLVRRRIAILAKKT